MTVATTAAVTDADVEKSVRAERDVAAVVIALRIVDVEQLDLACRVQRRPVAGQAELRHPIDQAQRSRAARIEEEYPRIGRIVRMEGHAEQAALVVRTRGVGVQPRGEVDELARARDRGRVVEHANRT